MKSVGKCLLQRFLCCRYRRLMKEPTDCTKSKLLLLFTNFHNNRQHILLNTTNEIVVANANQRGKYKQRTTGENGGQPQLVNPDAFPDTQNLYYNYYYAESYANHNNGVADRIAKYTGRHRTHRNIDKNFCYICQN